MKIYSVLLIILMISCRPTKEFQQPEPVLPAQFGLNASADSSIATMDWKHFFADTSLQRLIAQTLDNNYDLQFAIKTIEQAQAYFKQAKANRQPTVNLLLSGSTNIPSKNSINGLNLSNFTGKDHVEDFSLGAGVSWEIDVWGKLKHQRNAANATYLQSYEARNAIQTTLIANVANGYFNLLMLDEQRDIAARNLLLGDSIVRMIRFQKDAGQVTELAVQQATVQRDAAALLIPALEENIAIQEYTLSILSGTLPGHIMRGLPLKEQKNWENLPTGIPTAMVSHRPDIRQNQQAMIAAYELEGVAKASMYPSLNITAQGGLNAFEVSKWFTVPSSLFATAAANIIQPVLQQRRLRTQLEVSQIQKEQTVIRFRQSVLNAVGEVEGALVRLEQLEKQDSIIRSQYATVQQSIINAQLLFKSGLADYLEVINAQGNSLETSLALTNIERKRFSAAIELYRALGGGWE